MLTLPGWLVASALLSRGEKVALHGAELSGVVEYGDEMDLAEAIAGEKGDCGMRSRGVRADFGPGLAKGEGGMMILGDSGRA